MQAEDESNMTELEILPDGRICVFGASREVLEVFQDMPMLSQEIILRRLNQQYHFGSDDASSTSCAPKMKTHETQRKQS